MEIIVEIVVVSSGNNPVIKFRKIIPSEKISILLKDDELRLKMGKAAYEKALKQFNAEINVKQVTQVYEKIIL